MEQIVSAVKAGDAAPRLFRSRGADHPRGVFSARWGRRSRPVASPPSGIGGDEASKYRVRNAVDRKPFRAQPRLNVLLDEPF